MDQDGSLTGWMHLHRQRMCRAGRGVDSLRGSSPHMTMQVLYRNMRKVMIYYYYRGVNCQVRVGSGKREKAIG